MSRYNFNEHERFAIFCTHGEKCYLCSEPLNLKTMEVDHVIPESLIGTTELHAVLENLGLPTDFNVNSFANWLPACKPCNGKKSNHVFSSSLMFQNALENAAKKAPKAESFAADTVSQQKIANALNVFGRASEEERLDDATVAILAVYMRRHRQPELVGKPIRFTPFDEVLEESNGNQYVLTPCGNGLPRRVDIINKATGIITTGPMLIGNNPNDCECDPVSGVIRLKPRGL